MVQLFVTCLVDGSFFLRSEGRPEGRHHRHAFKLLRRDVGSPLSRVLEGDPAAERVAARVRELTAFLVEEPRRLAGMSSEAAAAFSDLEPMRDRARQIRLDTLSNLDLPR